MQYNLRASLQNCFKIVESIWFQITMKFEIEFVEWKHIFFIKLILRMGISSNKKIVFAESNLNWTTNIIQLENDFEGTFLTNCQSIPFPSSPREIRLLIFTIIADLIWFPLRWFDFCPLIQAFNNKKIPQLWKIGEGKIMILKHKICS